MAYTIPGGSESKGTLVAVISFLLLVVLLIAGFAWGLPKYRIYRQDLRGQAELREAEWTKRISIEEAKALKESATLKADADIERAKGIAESNRIIGDSLRGNEAYLRFLWIEGLKDGSGERIYIPTEAGLPILEARPN